MEYINKNKDEGKNRVHRLLRRFLDRSREKNPYPTDLYGAMKDDVDPDPGLNPDQKSTYRLLLEWILEDSRSGVAMSQGEGYCCYCMRRIKADGIHSTLEHVIPKTVDEMDDYLRYFAVPSELENDEHIMVMKTVFFRRHHRQAPPFPHNVAYENLVASCDGSLPKGSNNHVCCNNPRGNHYIPPLMFMPNIRDEIKYKKSGMVIWKDNPDIDKRERKRVINDELKLNHDVLRIIRRIWCHLSEHGMDCNLNETERRRLIDTMRSSCLLAADKEIIQNFLENDNYWELLEEYSYFNDFTKFT